jgi:hypothetical protein
VSHRGRGRRPGADHANGRRAAEAAEVDPSPAAPRARSARRSARQQHTAAMGAGDGRSPGRRERGRQAGKCAGGGQPRELLGRHRRLAGGGRLRRAPPARNPGAGEYLAEIGDPAQAPSRQDQESTDDRRRDQHRRQRSAVDLSHPGAGQIHPTSSVSGAPRPRSRIASSCDEMTPIPALTPQLGLTPVRSPPLRVAD